MPPSHAPPSPIAPSSTGSAQHDAVPNAAARPPAASSRAPFSRRLMGFADALAWDRGTLLYTTRTGSRYRVYAREDVQRLIFIRRARELGFTLVEIRDLLRLAAAVPDACAEVRDVAAGHLGDVRAKIADLEKMERLLAKAVRQCERGERPGCPMIDALSSGTIALSSGSRRLHADRTSGRPRSQRRRRRAARR